MHIYQYLLVFIMGVFFTLGITYGLKALLVYKKIDRFFYFSLLCLSAFVYTLAELFLSIPAQPLVHLIFHKIKLLSSLFCALGVTFLIVKIILPDFRFPRCLLCLPAIPALLLPTNWFSSFPIKNIHLNWLDIQLDYYLGTPQIGYKLYMILILALLVFSFSQLIKARIQKRISSFALLLPFPMLLAAINDFAVARELLKNIMLSEFFVFFFVIYIFYHFYREEQKNFSTLKTLNYELENLVEKRTLALETTHHALEEQHEKLKSDLQMAKRIQQCLMPFLGDFPSFPGLEFACAYHTMEELGGDFIDIYQANENEIFFLLADVSGHGPSAALITSMLKIAFSTHAKNSSDPAEIFSNINQTLYPSIGDLGSFISSVLIQINFQTGKLKYACAGHPPILWYNNHNKQILPLKSAGVFLGIFPRSDYLLEEVQLGPGDKLLLYTDGITEIRNKNRDFFGTENLTAFFLTHHHHKPELFLEKLHLYLKEFSQTSTYHDDQALIYLHYL